VTQGAVPIHIYNIYDGITTIEANGICFNPVTEIANSSMLVTLKEDQCAGECAYYAHSYENPTFGNTTTVQVTLDGPAYVNMHLDYGLKGTTGYSKNSNNDVTYPCTTLPCQVVIPNMENYMFSFGDSSSVIDSDTVQSLNVFKRDPGIGGLVLEEGSYDPVANVMVQIYDSSRRRLATVYTDQDGWYMWQYKYTGKPATFNVKLPDYRLTQSVTLK